jgi:DNA-directed RNA polymerase subunit RPC12/RpoP
MSSTPLKCTNCNAALTWRDAPVIECEYCHEKVMVDTSTLAVNALAAALARRSSGGTLRQQRSGLWIVAVIILFGIIGQVVRSRSKKAAAASLPPAEVTKPETPTKPTPLPPPPSVGRQVLEFGEAGTGAGQFTVARALAVTPRGEIVVAEASTGRVQVFDAKGGYQRLIMVPPDALAKQRNILGMGANSKGQVVASRSGDLVVLDVAAGTIARTIRGSYPDAYYHGDVDVAPDDTIYAVTDRTGDKALSKVSPAGKVVSTIKKTNAEHVAIDGVGTVFLSQWESVEVRDDKGDVVRKFSQGNPARGKLSHPGPIAYDGRGHLFLHAGNDVLIFDAEGAFLAALDTGSLNDFALDRAGALYTLTADKVRKYEITLPAK